MGSSPLPGNKEESFLASMNTTLHDAPWLQADDGIGKNIRATFNKYVSFKRNFQAVRNEIIQSARNKLEGRLDSTEFENIVWQIMKASSASELFTVATGLLKYIHCSSDDNMIAMKEQLGHDCFAIEGNTINLKAFADNKDIPALSYLCSFILSVCPDSLRIERVVSCLNNMKTSERSSTSLETLNDRIYIALNGSGTSTFDPRPCVAKFLASK